MKSGYFKDRALFLPAFKSYFNWNMHAEKTGMELLLVGNNVYDDIIIIPSIIKYLQMF